MKTLLLLLAGLAAACTSETPIGPNSKVHVPVDAFAIPDDAAAIFASADTWTLRSLDPAPHDDVEGAYSERLHGYGVLGSATILDRLVMDDLAKSLNEGIRGNNDMVAACFDPRHAISAEVDGERVDLVICFSCLQIKIHGPGDTPRSELTSSLPREAFDQIYRAHGLDIAPSGH